MSDNPSPVQPKNFYKAPVVLRASEAEIMRVLRKNGHTSRPEITRITGWSRAKTSQEISAMIKKGFLVETGKGLSKGGRKPRLLFLNNELGYVVGIDIGATSVEIALAAMNGKILKRTAETADVRRPPEELLGRCSALILELAAPRGRLSGMFRLRPPRAASLDLSRMEI